MKSKKSDGASPAVVTVGKPDPKQHINNPIQFIIPAQVDENHILKPIILWPDRLSSIQAAAYLGCAPYTIRRSRQTGKLAGVAAPKYRKQGKTVVYEKVWLDEWKTQFEPQYNTAQNVA